MKKKLRMLLVEDDVFTSRLIKTYFEERGFIVEQSFDIGSALFKSTPDSFDIAIIDIYLPSGSSLLVMDKIKSLIRCPIVVSTSDLKEDVELKSLSLGVVDEYVVKSRGLEVLLQRTMRILQQNEKQTSNVDVVSSNNNSIKVGPFELHYSINQISWMGNVLKLSNQEVKTINYLMLNANSLVSKDEFYHVVYGFEYDGANRSFDLLMSRLRRKLADKKIPFNIVTIAGRGHVLRIDDL